MELHCGVTLSAQNSGTRFYHLGGSMLVTWCSKETAWNVRVFDREYIHNSFINIGQLRFHKTDNIFKFQTSWLSVKKIAAELCISGKLKDKVNHSKNITEKIEFPVIAHHE
jgi:hypothetical protein